MDQTISTAKASKSTSATNGRGSSGNILMLFNNCMLHLPTREIVHFASEGTAAAASRQARACSQEACMGSSSESAQKIAMAADVDDHSTTVNDAFTVLSGALSSAELHERSGAHGAN